MQTSSPAVAGSQFYQRALLALVLVLGVFYCLYNTDRQSIDRRTDEMIHVRVVQEMVHDGHILVPTWYGTPYLNKPPLKLWLSAAVVWAFGESNRNYRLLDGLCGIGILVLTYLFCLRNFSAPLAGFFSAVTLCGARHLISGPHGVRHATQDPFMLLLCTGALFAGFEIVKIYRGDQLPANPAPLQRERNLHLIFGLLIGAAVLTKSVAGAVPCIVLCSYLIFDSQARRAAATRWRLWFGVIALGLVPVVLFVAYQLLMNRELFLWATRVEIVDRALSGFHNGSRSFYYWRELFFRDTIATPIVLGLSLLFIGSRAIKEYRYRYLLCWAIVPIVLFSTARSRMVWYIFVAYPALAAAAGLFTAELLQRKDRYRLLLIFGVAVSAQLFFRAYRIGHHVVAERVSEVDRFVTEISKRGAEPRAIIDNPFRIDPVMVNNLGRLDLVYLTMLGPTAVSSEDAIEPKWRTVLCTQSACDELEQKRGTAKARATLPGKSLRPEPVVALMY